MPTPPPPPRTTGDPQADFIALSQWTGDFFKAAVLENGFVQSNGQFDPGDFDPSTLPDPASATIGGAQQTANQAYSLAANAKAIAQKFRAAGTVTISDAATTGDFTFPTAEADTSYFVSVTPSAKAGSPAPDSNVIESLTKATSKVTLTLTAAPGVGTSRTFDVLVFRQPS